MTSFLFEEELRRWDGQLKKAGRTVIPFNKALGVYNLWDISGTIWLSNSSAFSR